MSRALVAGRKAKGLSQAALATRVGRSKPRIVELERDLAAERRLQDRLSLLLDVCDVLDLVPIPVPRSRVLDVMAMLQPEARTGTTVDLPSVLDESFVDLSDEG